MSPFVRFEGASFAYEARPLLLQHLDFRLDRGWSGVVGENGAGKTTLLGLVLGHLAPSAGHVRVSGAVVCCAQQSNVCSDAVRAFADDPGPRGWQWLGTLDLAPDMLARWDTLSPGERKRFQLAEALAAEPDVLLVDEPTNHLDADGRERVLAALQRFGGVGLVVSHDREVLARLTGKTLRLAGGTARLWPGSYDAARDAWLAEEAHDRDVRAEKKAAVEKLRRQLAEHRRAQDAAHRQRSTGARMKGPRDSDARTLGADFRASSAEKRHGRNVEVARRGHARAEEALAAHRVTKAVGGAVVLEHAAAARPTLLHLARDTGAVGGRTLWKDVTLTVAREDRVWLSGANGAGKSTLLRRLHDGSTLPPERVLYLPQELSADGVLDALRVMPADEKGNVLARVAALGLDPDRLLASRAPSPGELRKLLIARALAQEAWLLLLDEPTNHLDLPSVERLEDALRGFPGALIVVSHDARFAQAVTAQRWVLADETVVLGG